MTHDELKELLNELYPDEEIVVFDGLEDAVIGVARQFSKQARLVYDREKCLDVFVSQGMTYDEAEEWMSFNVEGLWAGEGTPLIMVPMYRIQEQL